MNIQWFDFFVDDRDDALAHPNSFNVPGHGFMDGTTNFLGTFKSPYAALYICNARTIAFHSRLSVSDVFRPFTVSDDDMNNFVVASFRCEDRVSVGGGAVLSDDVTEVEKYTDDDGIIIIIITPILRYCCPLLWHEDDENVVCSRCWFCCDFVLPFLAVDVAKEERNEI